MLPEIRNALFLTSPSPGQNNNNNNNYNSNLFQWK